MKKRRPLPIPAKASHNQPCPCGSARTLAQCCGSAALARRMATAVTSHQNGHLDVAAAAYAAILAEHPGHADALHYRGLIHFQRGTCDEAAAEIRAAIALRPEVAAYHANLGNVLKRLGQMEAALAAYARALQLDPGQAAAHYNQARLLAETGQPAAAIAALQEALKRRPDWPEAWSELGRLLYAEEAIDAATAAYQQALKYAPQRADTHLALGALQLRHGDVAAAISSFAQAEQLDPALETACTSRLFALGFSTQHDGMQILAQHRDWQSRFADRIAPLPILCHPRGDHLRIAYLSPDLRRHAMRFFVRPMLRQHDRRHVSVSVYATHLPSQSDAYTAELRALADAWTDCAMLDDSALAQRIAQDGIDVLVDLAGHTQGGRMRTLAAQPARHQCSMLGYMTTTGASCITARITDAVAVPPAADAWFSEKILRLPHSQWCYAPDAATPPVAGLPAHRQGHVTYGAFHNAAKLNPQVLGLWARLLKSQPAARLLMVGWGEAAQRTLRAPFEAAGVGTRVTVLDPLPYDRYLSLYDAVDISLDSFPYAGGTVGCESLWMGVPVLTLAHDSPAGRGGASILSALDLNGWIARDEDEWLQRAHELAGDLRTLADLRAGLRARMQASPLMDAAGYVNALENLLADFSAGRPEA